MTSTSKPFAPGYSPDTCMFCHQPLRITTGTDIDADEELEEEQGEATVIDDVELYCGPPGSGPGGHHTHWTCLIEHVKQVRATSTRSIGSIQETREAGGATTSAPTAIPLATCMVCGKNTLDPAGRFVVDVRNEGGETRGFDFGVILEEELYLDTHPNQLHIRAFHDLVAEGDYTRAIELIAEHDVDVNGVYGNEGLTALQKAVFCGDTGGVQFLQSLGATV